ASPADPWTKCPSPSGPGCRIALVILLANPVSTGSPRELKTPQIPHILVAAPDSAFRRWLPESSQAAPHPAVQQACVEASFLAADQLALAREHSLDVTPEQGESTGQERLVANHTMQNFAKEK